MEPPGSTPGYTAGASRPPAAGTRWDAIFPLLAFRLPRVAQLRSRIPINTYAASLEKAVCWFVYFPNSDSTGVRDSRIPSAARQDGQRWRRLQRYTMNEECGREKGVGERDIGLHPSQTLTVMQLNGRPSRTPEVLRDPGHRSRCGTVGGRMTSQNFRLITAQPCDDLQDSKNCPVSQVTHQ
jgi:hypothetical protein